ncbi:hypothetical protein A2153_03620 [Candidatus Gottesmanbacteria bacterium RBG_16_38_7b]|uniref:Peptidase C39-like domain-containing protein n=1 Tax=Candidatus Gottesmanbacteria bacterium RBG_16_38_7b TaxID=1798372 RepID=A0A1F5YHQ8_9BACT|nr:MAG: hypothetical protein A2153_03620 [Candidatus Gottesmanbacteria bacterium RBG_16_38_7b]
MEIPTNYILSIKPKGYLTQGLSHCGAFSVKAILSAYGLDNKTHPKNYHPVWIGKLTGLTLGKNYYVNILKSYGVDSEIKTAENLSNNERLDLLKSLLAQDTPVMVRIGNGYIHSTKYNPILGRIFIHWITLWGYDDRKQIFYVYDSAMLKKHWSKNNPIGNTTRTYKEILRDWNFGKWHPLNWIVIPKNFVYIKINPYLTGLARMRDLRKKRANK